MRDKVLDACVPISMQACVISLCAYLDASMRDELVCLSRCKHA
jgi:hypothetical protein